MEGKIDKCGKDILARAPCTIRITAYHEDALQTLMIGSQLQRALAVIASHTAVRIVMFTSLFKAGYLRQVKEERSRIEMLLAITLAVGPLLLYRMLGGVNLALWAICRFQTRWAYYLVAIGLILFSVIFHEILHGVGLIVLGNVSWRAIRLRFKKWPKWTPYTICTQPICVRACRQSLLLPWLLLGVVPGLIGFICRINGLALLAILNVMFCTTDLVSFWNSLKYESSSVLRMQQ